MQIPEFKAAVAARWEEVTPAILYNIAHIEATAEYFADDFLRNFSRHRFLGRPTSWSSRADLIAIDTFAGQVEWLVDWMNERVNWLDDFFNGRLDDYCHLQTALDIGLTNRATQIYMNGALVELKYSPIRLAGSNMLWSGDFAQLGIEVILGVDYIQLGFGEDVIIYNLDTASALLNGNPLPLAPLTVRIGHRVFMPLRGVVEAFGMEIGARPGSIVEIIAFLP
jgi:hypothetical protein